MGSSLDLFGHRLTNCFVDRRPGSGLSEELRRISTGLGGGSTVIFPEGRCFTPERKRRVVATYPLWQPIAEVRKSLQIKWYRWLGVPNIVITPKTRQLHSTTQHLTTARLHHY